MIKLTKVSNQFQYYRFYIKYYVSVWYTLLQTPLKNKLSTGPRRNTNSRRVAIREGRLTDDFYK